MWASTSAVTASVAEATTYQVRTQTSARATQHLRSDTTFAASRVVSQSLMLSAHDLLDNDTGDLNARLRLRYTTDLGLNQDLRGDPLFDARWNDLSLDLAYVEWQPVPSVEITAGRHWRAGPLGMADLDGVSVDWAPDGDGWQPFVGVAAGRDVQRGLTPWDPGAWDVQGLPPNESLVTRDPWHLTAATNAGVRRGRLYRFEAGTRHHRRPHIEGPTDAATTHRLGATATASVWDPTTVTATGSYHSVVNSADRARLDVAHRVGTGAVSAGVDHRIPVFDSSSIFNVFGARPHRSAYGTWRQPIERLSTTLQLRGWTRLYFEETPGLFDAGDDRAVGAAVANRHRFDARVPLDVHWQLSAQTFLGASGGDQYLTTVRARAPGPIDGLFLTGRLMGLWALPDHHRRDAGIATAASLGADVDLGEIAVFSVTAESRLATVTRHNTAVFGLLELETGL